MQGIVLVRALTLAGSSILTFSAMAISKYRNDGNDGDGNIKMILDDG